MLYALCDGLSDAATVRCAMIVLLIKSCCLAGSELGSGFTFE